MLLPSLQHLKRYKIILKTTTGKSEAQEIEPPTGQIKGRGYPS
jgi:hypothetical protein